MKKKAAALVSSALPDEAVSCLAREFEVIPLPPDSEVDRAICTHPDTICTALGEKIFFPKSYTESYPGLIRKIVSLTGLEAVSSQSERGRLYPLDVSLNTAQVGKYLLCREKSLSSELYNYAQELGLTVLDTKQGYAGCSCLVCGESVLTSDKGIYSLLRKHGVDCGLFGERIYLEGYDSGFIGGCGGFYDGRIYLFGQSGLDGFAKERGYEPVHLMSAGLQDFGGIKFLNIKQKGYVPIYS